MRTPSRPLRRWLPGAGVLAAGLALWGGSLLRSPEPDESASAAAPESPAASSWEAVGGERSREPSGSPGSPRPGTAAGKVADRNAPPPAGSPGAPPLSLVDSMRAAGIGASSQKGPGLPARQPKMAPGEAGWRDQAVFDADLDAAPGIESLIEEAGLAAADPSRDHGALLGRLRDALAAEADAELGQDLLNAAAELAARDPAALGELLTTALDESRPVEIRRAALYLAAGNRELLESIASDAGHDLRTDAAALLLDQDRAAGRIEPPRDTPVEEQ